MAAEQSSGPTVLLFVLYESGETPVELPLEATVGDLNREARRLLGMRGHVEYQGQCLEEGTSLADSGLGMQARVTFVRLMPWRPRDNAVLREAVARLLGGPGGHGRRSTEEVNAYLMQNHSGVTPLRTLEQWRDPSKAKDLDLDISSWDTSGITDMQRLFAYKFDFNDDISTWNTAAVTNMECMFAGAKAFNQDIGTWNTAAVTNMQCMFNDAAAFNNDIGTWNTGAVTDMQSMFNGAKAFNHDIGTWNTAEVTNMKCMFAGARAFNRDIGTWNTAKVTNTQRMFEGAAVFNQDIGGWNTAAVTEMRWMFNAPAAFNQDISRWANRPNGW